MTLNTAPYRGTRDFLPDEMSVRSQVFARLFTVIESFGYVRYDGPMLEPIEIYEAKSGEEIVREQLYRLTDRAGRVLALRPEMTPSVARIIAAHAARLQLPARWYTQVNCHRYERPQRGRVREHWQINVDVFGSESPDGEVEIFELIHQMFAALGATPGDYVLRASDRTLVQSALTQYASVTEAQMPGVFQVIDRWEKYPLEHHERLARVGLESSQIQRVGELMEMDFGAIAQVVSPEVLEGSKLARILRNQLTDAPITFDPLIVRGFDYYTSTVFEVFDRSHENRRSLFGGGRYDNLVALFSDRRIPGIGFGMGDVTLFDFLGTHGLLPEPHTSPDVYIVPVGRGMRQSAKEIARDLRQAGLHVVLPLEDLGLTKGLRDAARRGAGCAVIVADAEAERGAALVRDLDRGEQSEVLRDRLAEAVRALVARGRA